MKKLSWVFCGLLYLFPHQSSAQDAQAFPPLKTLGPVESYGRNIQRTMGLLAASTPEHRNTVKILFYGQSITEQTWSKLTADDLRRRFPHADLVIENRAIGGHSSPRLVKTMEADVFSFYPDLVIFHVYGDDADYERIIRAIRSRTTAEVLIQTDHLRRNDDPLAEETNPEKIQRSKDTWNSWMNYVFLPRLARECGAELVNQRDLWKAYLRDYKLEPGQLLKDNVHLNEHGNYVMAEIVKLYLRYDPKFPNTSWKDLAKTFAVGKQIRPSGRTLTLEFEGNRVDLIAKDGSLPARSSKPTTVEIDGRAPSAFPELYGFNRVTHYPKSTWPTMLRVQQGKPQQIEDWTLTLTELSSDYKQVKFTLAGSKTGSDGAGVSTERFVSNSGRIIIDPGDWNLEYCLQVFKRPIEPGFKIEWKVIPKFHDTLIWPSERKPGVDAVITIAQGLPNGKHRLTISGELVSSIAAVRIYRPIALEGSAK